MIDLSTPCTPHPGYVGIDGYGQVGITHTITVRAHRLAYEREYGPIPAGVYVDHLCHNADPTCPGGRGSCLHRRCVNPRHLALATSRENTLRGRSLAARNAVKVACSKGHPFDAANTYRTPKGDRDCRACGRDRWHRKQARLADTPRRAQEPSDGSRPPEGLAGSRARRAASFGPGTRKTRDRTGTE